MSQADKPLVNRVAQSGLTTIKPEEFLPDHPVVGLDLKDYLFQELILREKDFRQAICCPVDAIIPVWAYMLVAVEAQPFAHMGFQGTPESYTREALIHNLSELDTEAFRDQRVVIKGCSDKPVPPAAYLELTRLLRPVAKSIMYGEPCSTVPIFKRK